MKVCISTLGCKLNQAESDKLARQFLLSGHEIVASPHEADLHIVNTCAVTHTAVRKSRKALRKGLQHRTDLVTVLTGCYAEMAPREIQNLAGVDLVVGNRDKEQLLKLLEATPVTRGHLLRPGPDTDSGPAPLTADQVPPELWAGEQAIPRTRAFVKIQDGCNMRCAFCIIPLVRGRERSRPRSQIIDEIRSLVTAGHQEVVLTGVQISAYRDGGVRLRELVSEILGETAVSRLRLSSLAPWHVDRRLLKLWAEGRMCRHLHLSLQSGSDTVLRRMKRPYTAARYAEVAELAREMIADVAITTDVIVGFPGETQAEFKESRRFVERMRFARVHVFSYSARDGTVAAGMHPQVPPRVKQSRSRVMREIAKRSAESYQQRFIGRTMDVLWESRANGCWCGLTDNYIRVTAEHREGLTNAIVPAELVELTGDGVRARVVAG